MGNTTNASNARAAAFSRDTRLSSNSPGVFEMLNNTRSVLPNDGDRIEAKFGSGMRMRTNPFARGMLEIAAFPPVDRIKWMAEARTATCLDFDERDDIPAPPYYIDFLVSRAIVAVEDGPVARFEKLAGKVFGCAAEVVRLHEDNYRPNPGAKECRNRSAIDMCRRTCGLGWT